MTITFDPLFEAGHRLARRQGVPFVAFPLSHLGAGQQPGQDATSRFYTMRHQSALVTTSSALVAQTPAESRYYQGLGMPAECIVVSGPGVTPEELTGGDGERFQANHGLFGPVILSIGAMSPDKGTCHVVEAVRRLWAAGRQVELVLIGEVLSPFRKFISEIPAADRERIRLLGPVDEAEKRDALAAGSMLAMPSRTDSFGMVYLEAWVYSLPVIGATTWGVMDVIANGQDGLLVPFGDVDLLTQAMVQLLDNPEKAREMGRRGRKKVIQEHTWQQKCQLVHELYQSLTKDA
jgi:glycosyltransferase involved in cell wall biosynthesis